MNVKWIFINYIFKRDENDESLHVNNKVQSNVLCDPIFVKDEVKIFPFVGTYVYMNKEKGVEMFKTVCLSQIPVTEGK